MFNRRKWNNSNWLSSFDTSPEWPLIEMIGNFIYLGKANCEFVVYPRADGDSVKVFVFHNLNYIYLSLFFFFLGGGGITIV